MCIYILHSVNEKSIQFEANLFILVILTDIWIFVLMLECVKSVSHSVYLVSVSHVCVA